MNPYLLLHGGDTFDLKRGAGLHVKVEAVTVDRFVAVRARFLRLGCVTENAPALRPHMFPDGARALACLRLRCSDRRLAVFVVRAAGLTLIAPQAVLMPAHFAHLGHFQFPGW